MSSASQILESILDENTDLSKKLSDLDKQIDAYNKIEQSVYGGIRIGKLVWSDPLGGQHGNKEACQKAYSKLMQQFNSLFEKSNKIAKFANDDNFIEKSRSFKREILDLNDKINKEKVPGDYLRNIMKTINNFRDELRAFVSRNEKN
jgi:cell division septum initiation protein DivIVA